MFIEINNSITSPIYLDLGSALAAFGLIFATYQLRTPRWDLILRLRNNWQKNLIWLLGGLGLITTLIRVVLNERIIQFWVFPFNILLFYEIAAYIFFILSPISLLYFARPVKGLFNKKNARKFYDILIREIAQISESSANNVLEILLYNFRDICETAHGYKKNDDPSQSAIDILNVILSDDSIVKILTTKRLDALQFIFEMAEKYNITERKSSVGIPKIVHNLFYDKESFFYKHLDKNGLALSYNIYDSLFDSQTMLTNFNFFDYPTIEHPSLRACDSNNVEVFIKALSNSIITYLKTGKVPARHINAGLSQLSEIFQNTCYKISDGEKRGEDTKYTLKDEWLILKRIAYFLGHEYIFLAYKEQMNENTTNEERMTLEADFHSYQTINAGVAAALYEAFAQLTYIKDTTEIYHIVLDLFHGMTNTEKYKEGYRAPFEKKIWQQIALNVAHRTYPSVLKTYLVFIGFCLASDIKHRRGWLGEQVEKMRRLLYIDLKPLLENNVKMVNEAPMKEALLPKSMEYKNGKFVYRFRFGSGRESEIVPPPDHSESIIASINLEN